MPINDADQIRDFLNGTQGMDFAATRGDPSRYGFIEQVLVRFAYRRLGKADRADRGTDPALPGTDDRLFAPATDAAGEAISGRPRSCLACPGAAHRLRAQVPGRRRAIAGGA